MVLVFHNNNYNNYLLHKDTFGPDDLENKPFFVLMSQEQEIMVRMVGIMYLSATGE